MSAREPIGRHESAVGHVTGRAVYTDELHPPLGLASLYPVQVPHAHARLRGIDARAALALPGVLAVLTAADVPGENETGTILRDEPLIPADSVQFHGQAVAWVVAEDEALARRAAALVQVDAEPLPACLSIAAAIAAQAFHLPPAEVARGDATAALAAAPRRLAGTLDICGQDHFYLETQASKTPRRCRRRRCAPESNRAGPGRCLTHPPTNRPPHAAARQAGARGGPTGRGDGLAGPGAAVDAPARGATVQRGCRPPRPGQETAA